MINKIKKYSLNLSWHALVSRRIVPISKFSTKPSYIHNRGTEPLQYLTIGQMLENTVDRWPDRYAVISKHQEQSITYGELLKKADALAYGIRQYGIEKGDRIGIWSANYLEWLIVMYAGARGGFIPVALNPTYEKTELLYCMMKAGIKAMFIGVNNKTHNYDKILKELVPEIQTCKPGYIRNEDFPDLSIVINMHSDNNNATDNVVSMNTLIKDYYNTAKNAMPSYQSSIQPDDGYIIHFTSGTTGDPKAALCSHFSNANNASTMSKRLQLNENHEKICVQVPMFHAFGTVITALSAMSNGAALVFPNAFYSPTANAEAIYSEKCTVIYGTPTMFVDLMGVSSELTTPPETLRMALTAGSPCSPQLFHDVKSILGLKTVQSIYGMTETTAAIFQSLANDDIDKITQTVGYLLDHLEVKVVDSSNSTVPFGQTGELFVRGYSTMLQYWGEPEKTKEVIGQDKWLRTGDQFVIEESGYGKIVGRIKDIIIRGGENIYPKEIEDVLNKHQDILESQVFGVKDDRLGEEICVAVKLKDGAKLTIVDISKFCEGQIMKAKIPKILRIVQDFPKTLSGKIQKYKLKEMVEDGSLRS